MREVYVVLRTDRGTYAHPVAVYSTRERAEERVMALRTRRPSDYYYYEMLPLDSNEPTPHEVVFDPHDLEWTAKAVETSLGESVHPQILITDEGRTLWKWLRLDALDRADAIRKARNYAVSVLTVGGPQ